MKPWTKNQLRRLRIALIINSDKRNKYLKKHDVFGSMGDNVFFQPRFIPTDPKLIRFHNNIIVTSNVTFVTHDIFNLGINYMNPDNQLPVLYKPIEIMDNVFIGCNSTILGGVRIGNNVVIAAGSVVTKDIPDNSVVAGNPAKVIESFDDYLEKRYKAFHSGDQEELWKQFYESKNKTSK